MENNLSLFQNWVLFILFKNPHLVKDDRQLMIECCDTAIEDLDESKIVIDLTKLENDGLINYEMLEERGEKKYKITTTGILYVRKQLLKPISDFVETEDYDSLIDSIGTPITKKIKSIKNSATTSEGELNKQVFNDKLTSLAINSIGPFINFLTKVMTML